MKKAICALIVVVLCACGSVRAQWTIDVTELTQHLDSVCAGSGHPLADGTEIRLYHDWNSNGPDNADTLLRVCDDPPNCDVGPVGSVNYNIFWINGANQPGCMASFPGGFNTFCPPLERAVSCANAEPVPNRIYVRVCADDRHYYSEVLSLPGPGGYREIEISNWTCVQAPCPGCAPPPQITQISATPGCRTIDIHWTYPQVPYHADSLFVVRQRQSGIPVQVASVIPTDTFFHDTITDARAYAFEYHYWIKAKHVCDSSESYAYSPPVSETPDDWAYPAYFLSATDTVCDSIQVTWEFHQPIGWDNPDSFLVESWLPDQYWGAVPWTNYRVHYGFWCHPSHHEEILFTLYYWSRGCGRWWAGTAGNWGQAVICRETADDSFRTLPTSFGLRPNFPNPFNSRTRIEFDLPRTAPLTLVVFNVFGQKVATLVNGITEAGNHMVDFDASTMPSGVYVVCMEADGWMSSGKMLLLK